MTTLNLYRIRPATARASLFESLLFALMLFGLGTSARSEPTPPVIEHRPCGPNAFVGPIPAQPCGQDGATEALGEEEEFRIALGRVLFRKQWVSAPASTASSDGLGPLYNARACEQCHFNGGRGQPEADHASGRPSALVLRLSVPPRTDAERTMLTQDHRVIAEPTYGVQLQPFAIQGHRSEGRLDVGYDEVAVELGDGSLVHLRRPSYRVANLGYGPFREDTMMSPRVGPPLVGLGLLELVPESQILEREGIGGGPGIAGVANRVWSKEQGKITLGRFGWKAGTSSLRLQVAEAFALDLGISSSLVTRPSGDCTAQQTQCLSAPDGRSALHGGHELDDKLLDLVTAFVAYRDLPLRSPRGNATAEAGEIHFHAIGCAACHRPSLQTSSSDGPPQLRGRTIWPYTDLLLHDMGEDLADGQPEGAADGRMWRTAPLWALGRQQTRDGGETFLHDGRARSIAEAVLWHGGEARAARDAFARLSVSERSALIDFVKSR